MGEEGYEVKESKVMTIFCCVGLILPYAALGIGIYAVIDGIINPIDNGEVIACAIALVISFIFLFLLIGMEVYLIYIYVKQRDMYYNDKMIRKRGDKVIFELEYKNIKKINAGLISVFYELETPIVYKNGKKGPRNFYDHYDFKDIIKIEEIISKYKTDTQNQES